MEHMRRQSSPSSLADNEVTKYMELRARPQGCSVVVDSTVAQPSVRLVVTFSPHDDLWINAPIDFEFLLPPSFPDVPPIIRCLDADFIREHGERAKLDADGTPAVTALRCEPCGWMRTYTLTDALYLVRRLLLISGVFTHVLDLAGTSRASTTPRLDVTTELGQVQSGHYSARGQRPTMEDTSVWDDDVRVLRLPPATRGEGAEDARFALYGVFDGHGGSLASDYVASRLHFSVCELLGGSTPRDIPHALHAAFLRIDADFEAAVVAQRANDTDVEESLTPVEVRPAAYALITPGSPVTADASPTTADGTGGIISETVTFSLGNGYAWGIARSSQTVDSRDHHEVTHDGASGKVIPISLTAALPAVAARGNNKYGDASGCTAVVAVVAGTAPSPATSEAHANDGAPKSATEGGGCIVVASVGDSRAVLCRAGVAIALSDDHKVKRPDERARILDAGGFLVRGRVYGRLAVTRSFGDISLKRGVGGTPLVTAEPELMAIARHHDDEFMILACDGLWDVVTSDDAVHIARAELYRRRSSDGGAPTAVSPSDIARRLSDEAILRGSVDNVTIVIVLLRDAALPHVETARRPSVDVALGIVALETDDSPNSEPDQNDTHESQGSLMRSLDDVNYTTSSSPDTKKDAEVPAVINGAARHGTFVGASQYALASPLPNEHGASVSDETLPQVILRRTAARDSTDAGPRWRNSEVAGGDMVIAGASASGSAPPSPHGVDAHLPSHAVSRTSITAPGVAAAPIYLPIVTGSEMVAIATPMQQTTRVNGTTLSGYDPSPRTGGKIRPITPQTLTAVSPQQLRAAVLSTSAAPSVYVQGPLTNQDGAVSASGVLMPLEPQIDVGNSEFSQISSLQASRYVSSDAVQQPQLGGTAAFSQLAHDASLPNPPAATRAVSAPMLSNASIPAETSGSALPSPTSPADSSHGESNPASAASLMHDQGIPVTVIRRRTSRFALGDSSGAIFGVSATQQLLTIADPPASVDIASTLSPAPNRHDLRTREPTARLSSNNSVVSLSTYSPNGPLTLPASANVSIADRSPAGVAIMASSPIAVQSPLRIIQIRNSIGSSGMTGPSASSSSLAIGWASEASDSSPAPSRALTPAMSASPAVDPPASMQPRGATESDMRVVMADSDNPRTTLRSTTIDREKAAVDSRSRSTRPSSQQMHNDSERHHARQGSASPVHSDRAQQRTHMPPNASSQLRISATLSSLARISRGSEDAISHRSPTNSAGESRSPDGVEGDDMSPKVLPPPPLDSVVVLEPTSKSDVARNAFRRSPRQPSDRTPLPSPSSSRGPGTPVCASTSSHAPRERGSVHIASTAFAAVDVAHPKSLLTSVPADGSVAMNVLLPASFEPRRLRTRTHRATSPTPAAGSGEGRISLRRVASATGDLSTAHRHEDTLSPVPRPSTSRDTDKRGSIIDSVSAPALARRHRSLQQRPAAEFS